MPRGLRKEITDEDLRQAIQTSGSWRGVLRALGYAATSGGLSADLQQRAADLGIESSHFRGQRTWSDDELASAIRNSTSWKEVLDRMGLSQGGVNATAVKARAIRLRIDFDHIGRYGRAPVGELPFSNEPDISNLRRAAPAMATAWFLRRGYSVSYPTEPCSYDLIVDCGLSLHRVQVKTATGRDHGSKSWRCQLMRRTAFVKREPYDPDSIDFFFLVDGDLRMYIVPVTEVAGQTMINLPLNHREVK